MWGDTALANRMAYITPSGIPPHRRITTTSIPISTPYNTAPMAVMGEATMSVAMNTKSNSIVIMKDGAAVGVGAGDQSRVGAGERAVVQAGDRAVGAVAASDAFFPFRDGIDTLVAAGVTSIVEPGGSKNDQEIIDAANEHGISLVFSETRHFRH